MWPGDRRLCVLHEPFVVPPRPCSLETVDKAPELPVPMPSRRAWCGAVRCPGPEKAGLWPDPFRHQGHLQAPRLPWGLGQGGVWVEGTFWLGVRNPGERKWAPRHLKQGGAVIWWRGNEENSCFGRRRRLWGWRHHGPPGCLRPLGVATLARHTPRPRAAPSAVPQSVWRRPQSWVPAEMTLAYCIIYYSSPGRRTRFLGESFRLYDFVFLIKKHIS